MSTNPYQSPTSPGGFGGPPPGFNAAEKTNMPGLLLMITAGISIAVRVILLVLSMLGAGVVAAQGGDDGAAAAQMIGGLIGNVIGIAINGVTLFGGMKMRSLEGYSMAMAGAILAVIPCCSPCVLLGIPFGIWALVVLFDPQVKASFRG